MQFTVECRISSKNTYKQSVSWEANIYFNKPIFTTDGNVEDLLENNRSRNWGLQNTSKKRKIINT